MKFTRSRNVRSAYYATLANLEGACPCSKTSGIESLAGSALVLLVPFRDYIRLRHWRTEENRYIWGIRSLLTAAGIKISMDGRGRWMDNVFIERLCRSLKHEDVYLKGYADGLESSAV